MKFVEMIDIKDCDSTIIGCVEEPEIDKSCGEDRRWYLDTRAFVKQSDCSRWIEWDFSGSRYSSRGKPRGYNIDKITKAIVLLNQIRDEMVRVQAIYEEMQKEVDAHNATLEKDDDA